MRREGMRVETEGEAREIDIEVIPLKVPETEDPLFLILFTQTPPGAAPPSTKRHAAWLAQGGRELPDAGATAEPRESGPSDPPAHTASTPPGTTCR